MRHRQAKTINEVEDFAERHEFHKQARIQCGRTREIRVRESARFGFLFRGCGGRAIEKGPGFTAQILGKNPVAPNP